MEMKNTLAGDIEYLSCQDKFYQIFVDDSNNDVNICIWLREFKEVLAVLEFQPLLTKSERVYIGILVVKASCMPFLVALEEDQQAILRASVALEQIRETTLMESWGNIFPMWRWRALSSWRFTSSVGKYFPRNHIITLPTVTETSIWRGYFGSRSSGPQLNHPVRMGLGQKEAMLYVPFCFFGLSCRL